MLILSLIMSFFGQYFSALLCLCLIAPFVGFWRLKRCNADEIVIDVTPVCKLVGVMWSGFLGIYTVWLCAEMSTAPNPHVGPVMYAFFIFTGVLEAVACLVLGVAISRGFRLTQIRIDLERRVYSYRRVWIRQKVYQGSLDELKAIQIAPPAHRGLRNSVQFLWKTLPHPDPKIAFWFWNPRKAEMFALRLADVTHVPIW